jgi:hypothetical protein
MPAKSRVKKQGAKALKTLKKLKSSLKPTGGASAGLPAGLLSFIRSRKPSGRINADDIARAKKSMPTGRSAAAKKSATKGIKTKAGTFMGKLKTGKASPHTDRDESYLGWIGRRRSMLKDIPRQRRSPATGARIKKQTQARTRAKSKK